MRGLKRFGETHERPLSGCSSSHRATVRTAISAASSWGKSEDSRADATESHGGRSLLCREAEAAIVAVPAVPRGGCWGSRRRWCLPRG